MSSLLEVSAADWKKNKVYSCKAASVTAVFPKHHSPKLSSLVPSREAIHSQANAVLGCVISGFSPDNIEVFWKKAGSAQEGIVLRSTQRSDGTFETITYLTVPMQDWTKKQKYTCEVNHAPSGFSGQVNMTYQEGPDCFSKPVAMLFQQSNLNATFSDGSTQQYHCSAIKCEIK
ncbi:splenic IgW, short secretory form-like [Mobula birostris]|uniref:splenic IgW, short secretory form-like n=1 Tax=Mobula birostris TaxID=1983395 RepID=UPI003B28CD57